MNTKAISDYAIDEDGLHRDIFVKAEIVNREDGTVKSVFINGIDMSYWIAKGGLVIRPGGPGERNHVELTLVAKSITFRTE